MKAARAPRWAVSFADLCLLLLGFFILLQAQNGRTDGLAAGLRSAFGTAAAAGEAARDLRFAAAGLFERDEAVLTAAAAERLRAIGAEARAKGRRVRIVSEGQGGGNARLDRWELAAARTAAIARGIRAGGLDEQAIAIAIPATSGTAAAGQAITVRIDGAR
ncbi:flagellar motor protein MotB [Sphingomonas fennica]|uniref:Flagellar motor protein n=1 Tax=Edaphosphingomonas fennica TaxID=114404 RepID=A0A2T4I7M3_9SPHN|nr:flagellar motor protein MotB [Sphingomonas fennica]PTD27315.1 flagellar motor protein [Sphingomonas fennica]